MSRFIRRFINAVVQILEDLDYTPTGQDDLEIRYKLEYHLSLIHCSTIVHAFSFFILILETPIFAKFYTSADSLSWMDIYYGFLIHLYWILLCTASSMLIFFRQHGDFSFYNSFVLLALSFGTLFEYGWYYSTGEWLRDDEFCDICNDDFPYQLFVKLIQVYFSVASIYKCTNAFRKLKEHQQILETISEFEFIPDVVNGG